MSAPAAGAPLELAGGALALTDLAAVARGWRGVAPATAAVERMRTARARLTTAAAGQDVYGLGTGVGANASLSVADGVDHDYRLLASHATTAGEPYPAEVARAALVVRANQLAAGRSGASPEVYRALLAAVAGGGAPLLHRLGGVGTGDLGALGEVGLALTGDGAWLVAPQPSPEPLRLAPGDALALLSSNAVTVAEAAIAVVDLTEVLAAADAVAALTFLAVRGNVAALHPDVTAARPHPGDVRAAAVLRALVGAAVPDPARLQDPFALRALPQVRGALVAALDRVADVLAVEIASGAENPMVPAVDPPVVLHHGGWWAGHLALALDGLRLALHSDSVLSVRRTALLLSHRATGQREFLAAGPPASSGAMALEYVAGAALGRLRMLAAPASLGTAVLSAGVEDHASFAPAAAGAAAEALEPLRVVVAAELVAAVRALRLAGRTPQQLAAAPAVAAYELALQALPDGIEDRSLSPDLTLAVGLLPALAATAQAGSASNGRSSSA